MRSATTGETGLFLGKSKVPAFILLQVVYRSTCWKGGTPMSKVQASAPKDQTSEGKAWPSSLLLTISGAMKLGVPQIEYLLELGSTLEANPKSPSLRTSPSAMKRLASLTSLWTTCCSWRQERALASCRRQQRPSGSLRNLRRLSSSLRDWWVQSYMMRKWYFSSWKAPFSLTMWGCWSEPWISIQRASLRQRSGVRASLETTLRAIWVAEPLPPSLASQTVAKDPEPRGFPTRKVRAGLPSCRCSTLQSLRIITTTI